jgi:hypothetical protein
LAKIDVKKTGKEWTNSEMRSTVEKLRKKYNVVSEDSDTDSDRDSDSDADEIDASLLNMLQMAQGRPPTLTQQVIEPIPPPERAIIPDAEAIIEGYPGNARTYTPEVIGSILTGLCAPRSERKNIGLVTKVLLEIWEQTDVSNATANGMIDGKKEREALASLPECPEGIRNAFERQFFASLDGTLRSTKVLTDLLDQAPPTPSLSAGGLLGAEVPLSAARARIAQLRRDCFANIQKLPGAMQEQVTMDFLVALRDYAARRRAAPPLDAAQPASLPPC